MLVVPSLLADATIAAEEAHQAVYEALQAGDWQLHRQKLIEWQIAARQRLLLTPPPRR
jgi:hypothetical protein